MSRAWVRARCSVVESKEREGPVSAGWEMSNVEIYVDEMSLTICSFPQVTVSEMEMAEYASFIHCGMPSGGYRWQ